MNGPHYDFVRECALQLDLSGPVVELGSRKASGQEDWELRRLFPGEAYVGVDMCDGEGVDLVADMCDLPFEDEFAGTVVCCGTLEHCSDPWGAVDEMYRICAGTVIVTVPFSCPLHAHPKDYWRFTPDGVVELLKEFDGVAFACGPDKRPHTVGGVNADVDMSKWQQRWRCKPKVKLMQIFHKLRTGKWPRGLPLPKGQK